MAGNPKFDHRKIDAFLGRIGKNVNEVVDKDRAYIETIAAFVFQDIIKHFQEERGPSGKWVDWSAMYESHMIRLGKGGNKILQDSGRLRSSFQPTNWMTQKDGILWFNPAKTASGFPYAKAHDEGGPKLPERKFMWLSDNAMRRVSTTTAKFFLQGV